jgi:PucR C-terminal helix-turn-helix domain/Purine catabolism regulatory protein-like family/GGDEF-like domain
MSTARRTAAGERDAPPGHATLQTLATQLGVELLRVVAAPAGLDVPVRGIVLHDAADESSLARDNVVLGIGLDSRDHEAADLVNAAAQAGAAAVVLKAHDELPPALVELARASGVALLAISAEAAWGQVYTLLRTAEATSGDTDDPALGGVAVGDLFTLANAVAAMVGGAITIEDTHSNVLAYSTIDAPIDLPRRRTILGRAVPEDWMRRLTDAGVFRRLWESDGPIRVDLSEFGEVSVRLAIGVRAGDQILGSMWAVEGGQPLGAEAEQALQSAAPIAALHLVRHYARDDLRRRDDSDALRAVLSGRLPPEQLTAAGLGTDSHITVLAFELMAGDEAAATVRAERVEGLVTLYLQAYRYDAVCAAVEGKVYVVLADAAPPTPERVRRLATGIADNAARGHRVRLRAGIGGTMPTLAGVLASRHEADSVLRVLAEGDAEQVVAGLDEVRERVILARLRDAADRDPALVAGKLDRLRDSDERGRSQYVATLRAYLDAFGDATRAAGLLGVHPNTYRYRLRRALELAEIDLDDPLERLVVHLQLYLLGDSGAPHG